MQNEDRETSRELDKALADQRLPLDAANIEVQLASAGSAN
jgi:hypothetical protein